MKILVTGAAGFIGSKITFMLAQRGNEVIGIDNINSYYDPRLKYGRLAELGINIDGDALWKTEYKSTSLPGLRFMRMDLTDLPTRNLTRLSILQLRPVCATL